MKGALYAFSVLFRERGFVIMAQIGAAIHKQLRR